MPKETKKQGQPPPMPAGGISAKIIYREKVSKPRNWTPSRFRSTNLESEGEEVHDVVAGSGVLNVPAVDVHGVLELLGPGLVVYPHAVHVVVGHNHELVHHRVEFCNATRFPICSENKKINSFSHRRRW